jgi:hypothetical protein
MLSVHGLLSQPPQHMHCGQVTSPSFPEPWGTYRPTLLPSSSQLSFLLPGCKVAIIAPAHTHPLTQKVEENSWA